MKTIAFISGLKGGTGKTTLAVNAAVVLSYSLRKKTRFPVVLIDMTPGVGTAAMLFLGTHSAQGFASLSEYFDGKLVDVLQSFYLRRWQLQQDEFNVVFAFFNKPTVLSARLLSVLIKQIEARLNPLALILDSPPTGHDTVLSGLLDFVVPVVTPDISSIATAAGVAKALRGKTLRPVLNMYVEGYDVTPIYGRDWPAIVRDHFGEEPHIIPADPSFEAARQALEIESLKLRPEESPGLAAMLAYMRYLATQLSI